MYTKMLVQSTSRESICNTFKRPCATNIYTLGDMALLSLSYYGMLEKAKTVHISADLGGKCRLPYGKSPQCNQRRGQLQLRCFSPSTNYQVSTLMNGARPRLLQNHSSSRSLHTTTQRAPENVKLTVK